jgi:hypothetical protein
MRKEAAIYVGTAVVAAVLAVLFWNPHRQSNHLTGESQPPIEELEAAGNTAPVRPAPSGLVPQPAVPPPAVTVPAVAQAVATPAAAPTVVTASNCEAMLPQAKQSASRAAAALAADLKLTPAETQQLSEIQEEQMTAFLPCNPQASSSASPEQFQAQLYALLGPARFEQMQEIITVRSTTQNMEALGRQLARNGESPLDAEQSRQLTATILEENRRSRSEATWPVPPTDPLGRLAYEEENLQLYERKIERTLKAAQSYLRPEQLAQLRDNTTLQAESMRANLGKMRASVEAGRGIPSWRPDITILDPPAPAPAR